ncbi:hypothetical protein RvY_06247-2 [Ramazzottius varieornatus]|uniref:Mediator of RNA polymerase II transcription subunit 15 n=1 Tax=Ramazzottius varieornatus TaxID=947166 RepID=A0A1D1UXV5_RAMVA|nr:hypothetical protein RvY_06247-2 [Ramazzottius varieornatus]
MVYPKSRLPNYKNNPTEKKKSRLEQGMKEEFRRKRDQIIAEFDKMFALYGNPTPKDSVQIEAQLFESSKTQVEYLILARRLLRTVLEMALLRQDGANAANTDATTTTTSTPSTSGNAQKAASAEEAQEELGQLLIDVESPSVAPSHEAVRTKTEAEESQLLRTNNKVAVIVRKASSQNAGQPSALPLTVRYGAVTLCGEGQRALVEDEGGRKRKRGHSAASCSSHPSHCSSKETLLVETRLLATDDSRQEGSAETVSDTEERYKALLTFLVPMGYRMKNVCVTLEKDAV